MSTRTAFCFLAMLAIVTSSLTSCGKKQASEIRNKAFVGKWAQDPSGQTSSGGGISITSATLSELCHLELNTDGTYKFTILDTDGNPLSPPQHAEGTWEAKGNTIHFTRSTHEFDEEHRDWDPAATISIGLKASGMDEDFLLTRNINSLKTRYVRPEADTGGE